MTDTIHSDPVESDLPKSGIVRQVSLGLARRYRADRRLRLQGQAAVGLSLLVLAILLTFVILVGKSAFQRTVLDLDITLDETVIDPAGTRLPETLARADYHSLIVKALRDKFPEVTGRKDRRALKKLISIGADYELRDYLLKNLDQFGTTQSLTLTVSSDVDMWLKAGKDNTANFLTDGQISWVEALEREGALHTVFNTSFLTNGDSREPELAGIRGAIIGSFLSLAVCIALALPLGVMAAIYLEELAPRNRLTRIIEVNINNLAAVPSIIFGILGLALFLNFFGLPRSAPLAGGMVLALMTLPTILIASRAALQAVPPSIREAALGLGASDIQTIFHHVVPLALPGMLTGAIIGMARALGETAPLLMIGMVAFIADTPTSITDPATVLPVQIYLWADSPERGFIEKTGAAIMVLLAFLLVMNSVAIYLRNKFETRW